MPSNVGKRKRAADTASASTTKKSKSPARPWRRRTFGALGGYGMARDNQVAVFNRKPVQVMTFKKTLYNAILLNGAGAYAGGTNYVTASPIPDWTYFKVLFSHYRIKRLKYVFTLSDYVAGDGKAFTNTRMPELFVRHNYDPNYPAPTGSTSMQELDNVVSFQMSPERNRFEYIVKPKQLAPTMVASGGATVGYRPITPQWTNIADDTVQHWGCLFFADFLDSSFRLVGDLEVELEFKSDR